MISDEINQPEQEVNAAPGPLKVPFTVACSACNRRARIDPPENVPLLDSAEENLCSQTEPVISQVL